MPSRLKIFDKKIQPCNPYREFWEFLEWLARRRHYPDPIYIWRAVKFTPQSSSVKSQKIKFPGYQYDVYNRFPAANESGERLNVFRRK